MTCCSVSQVARKGLQAEKSERFLFLVLFWENAATGT